MPNPEYEGSEDVAGDGASASDSAGESDSEEESEGAAESDSADESDRDEESTATGADPECVSPMGGLLSSCTYNEPSCPMDMDCILVTPGPLEDSLGYCTPMCVSDADCNWGTQMQCSDDAMICDRIDGASICKLQCQIDEDCYEGQVCSLIFGVCHPLG